MSSICKISLLSRLMTIFYINPFLGKVNLESVAGLPVFKYILQVRIVCSRFTCVQVYAPGKDSM